MNSKINFLNMIFIHFLSITVCLTTINLYAASVSLVSDPCKYFRGETENLTPEEEKKVNEAMQEEIKKDPKILEKNPMRIMEVVTGFDSTRATDEEKKKCNTQREQIKQSIKQAEKLLDPKKKEEMIKSLSTILENDFLCIMNARCPSK